MPPAGAEGDLVALGYKIVTETYAVIGPDVAQSARRFSGNNLSCQNCHLNAGTVRSGLPLVGVFRQFPWISPDGKREVTLRDRLNECMTHSMDGKPLPHDSREMNALVAYMKFIGGPPAEPAPMPKPPTGRCRTRRRGLRRLRHLPPGGGPGARIGSAPTPRAIVSAALGSGSQLGRRHELCLDCRQVRDAQHAARCRSKHPQLSVQEAWDVAAYLHAQQRPIFPTHSK